MQHTFHVVIEGIAPLIQNNPAEALKGMAKNSRKKATPAQTPDEGWRVKVYLSSDGKTLEHPSNALEAAIKEAAGTFKAKGRGSMKTAVKRTCFVDGDWLTITNKQKPDTIRELHPRNGAGQLVSNYLPEFAAGWQMEFYLQLTEDEIIEPAHLKEILDFAGARIGIGVNRPKYGRFMVVKWEEVGDRMQRAAAD